MKDYRGYGVWSVAEDGIRPVVRLDGWGWRVPVRSGVGRAAFASALLEAEAVAVHLQDVDMVGEAVEQSAGEAF